MHASNIDFTTDVHTNGQSQYAVSCTLKNITQPLYFLSTLFLLYW